MTDKIVGNINPTPLKPIFELNTSQEESGDEILDFKNINSFNNPLQSIFNSYFLDENSLETLYLPERYSAIFGNTKAIPDEFYNYEPDGTKDGVIGYTKQRATGDCWLLSGINSLSYSKAGSDAIKDALEYHDGYTIVHFKGGAGNVVITDKELANVKAQTATNQYCEGDEDMIILELATEKVIDAIYRRELEIIPANNADISYINTTLRNSETELGRSSVTSGWPNGIIFLLTGKVSTNTSDRQTMDSYLDEYMNNPENIVLCSTIKQEGAQEKGEIKVQHCRDIYDNDIELICNHSYSIKSASKHIVIIVNPWDSSKEIILTRETFLDFTRAVIKADLSQGNPEILLINKKLSP